MAAGARTGRIWVEAVLSCKTSKCRGMVVKARRIRLLGTRQKVVMLKRMLRMELRTVLTGGFWQESFNEGLLVGDFSRRVLAKEAIGGFGGRIWGGSGISVVAAVLAAERRGLFFSGVECWESRLGWVLMESSGGAWRWGQGGADAGLMLGDSEEVFWRGCLAWLLGKKYGLDWRKRGVAGLGLFWFVRWSGVLGRGIGDCEVGLDMLTIVFK